MGEGVDGKVVAECPDSKRGDRRFRSHDDYREDHWTVVDIDGVDKVYATHTREKRGRESVRIDLDGFRSKSVMADVGEPGDNINTSVWFHLPEAVELREQLDEAIQEAREND